MKVKIISVILIKIITLLLLFNCIEATTYNVGDGLNWVDPPTSTVYSIWASTHVFVKGDVLVFNFNTGIHNVAEVTKKSYYKCNTTNSIISLHHQSPVRIPLEKSGERYFISSLNNDCQNGQKLALDVLQHLPPPPQPPPPATAPPETAPTSNNPPQPLPAATPNNQVVTPPSSRNSATYKDPYYHVSFLCVLLCLSLGILNQFIL